MGQLQFPFLPLWLQLHHKKDDGKWVFLKLFLNCVWMINFHGNWVFSPPFSMIEGGPRWPLGFFSCLAYTRISWEITSMHTHNTYAFDVEMDALLISIKFLLKVELHLIEGDKLNAIYWQKISTLPF